ncbi:MAG: 5-formyltetrahydrofolate cyclo-ligase [Campylobacterota bacterium]|nr:5-formyltetrahydrofolate cyclo-ligase [Campylobacterota bacterium]
MSFEDKDNFRKLSLNKLKFYSNIAKIKKDKTISLKIYELIKIYKPKKILLYIPLDIEVDLRVLINKLRKQKNIEVYVPYMKDKSFVPVKYRLPLYKKRFGIKEPNFSRFRKTDKLDMVVVPIIGIDPTYRRIGFGAGMYDRFFETLKNKPICVFTQLKLCKSDKIITSDYDIKPDYIITM